MFQDCFQVCFKHVLRYTRNMLWIIIETPLNILELFSKHAWNMLETCLKLAWNMLETYLKYAWNMLESCLKHAWNMLEICLKDYGNTFELSWCSEWLSSLIIHQGKKRGWTDERTNANTDWHHHFLSCSSQLKIWFTRESSNFANL